MADKTEIDRSQKERDETDKTAEETGESKGKSESVFKNSENDSQTLENDNKNIDDDSKSSENDNQNSKNDNQNFENNGKTKDENEIPLSVYKLHDAAKRFDVKAIEELIATGYDVNEKYDEGYNVIHSMLQTYVELNLIEQIHVKPKFIEILSLLVRNGIDINSVDKNKQTALHFIAAQGSYADIIKPLLAAGIRVNTQDFRSHTALHAAILKGHVNNVQALVEGGADTDVGDTKGETALHMLSKGKRKLKLVQLLIKCGANVNSRDVGKRTPLHTSCKYSRAELVRELLISGAKVNAIDSSGQSPLHYAVKCDMTGAIVEELLKRTARIDMKDSINEETALHKSIKYGTIEAFKLLVKNNPLPDPNIKDFSGETALHRAASCQDIYVWKQLIKLGGDVSVTNDNGYTPIQKTLRVKNSVALSLMREHGFLIGTPVP